MNSQKRIPPSPGPKHARMPWTIEREAHNCSGGGTSLLQSAYTVETDASINSLGAVLAQIQPDGRLQPVAYASRSLSAAKRNYSDIRTGDTGWCVALARLPLWAVGDSPHRPCHSPSPGDTESFV